MVEFYDSTQRYFVGYGGSLWGLMDVLPLLINAPNKTFQLEKVQSSNLQCVVDIC